MIVALIFDLPHPLPPSHPHKTNALDQYSRKEPSEGCNLMKYLYPDKAEQKFHTSHFISLVKLFG